MYCMQLKQKVIFVMFNGNKQAKEPNRNNSTMNKQKKKKKNYTNKKEDGIYQTTKQATHLDQTYNTTTSMGRL